MSINDYISSGIVESYVLGLADAAERAEFESMCSAHEEVRAARDAFEQALETQAMSGAVAPPQDVKTKIFSQLAISTNSPAQTNNLKAVGEIPAKNQATATDSTSAPVIRSQGWSKYLAAASVALLVGSTILNFYLFNQYQEYSDRYSSLLASQTELANNNRALQTSLDTYRTNLSRMKDPAMSVIKMAGTAVPKNGSPDPGSVATIYWDKRSTEVYLMVNNLPKPGSDKQYQLWAIVDGKPVSAGVFDYNETDPVLKMTNISGASAFAITLEKRGGSVAPEGAMYVLGAI